MNDSRSPKLPGRQTGAPGAVVTATDGAILGLNPHSAAMALICDWYVGPGQILAVSDLLNDPAWPPELPTQAIRVALRIWVKFGALVRIGRGSYVFT